MVETTNQSFCPGLVLPLLAANWRPLRLEAEPIVRESLGSASKNPSAVIPNLKPCEFHFSYIFISCSQPKRLSMIVHLMGFRCFENF